jgi:hypothetical protein
MPKFLSATLNFSSDRPITKIHPHDIWAVVDEARRLGVPGLERRAIGRTDPLGWVMLACLSSFFGWRASARGRHKSAGTTQSTE